MPWAKLDDAMGEHRKVRRVLRSGPTGIGAFGLHALAILHASRYLTDGRVEDEFVAETLDKVKPRDRKAMIAALEAQGMWIREDGGWRLHDYLDHNPTRKQVESKREQQRAAKSRAGKAGAQARWHSSLPDEANGRRMADVSALPHPSDGPVPSRPLTPQVNCSGEFSVEGEARARDTTPTGIDTATRELDHLHLLRGGRSA